VIADIVRRAGIVVAAEAANGRQAIELVRRHRPDIVLMDVEMPGVDGIAATRGILRLRPDQVIILLSGVADEELAITAVRAGATGYLSKEMEPDVLARAITGALRGETAMSRTLARRVIERLRLAPTHAAGLRPVHSPLTRREWEVLDLLGQAQTVEEIASAFVVAPDTIRSHIKHIRRKLGARSHAETVAAARRMLGLEVDEEPAPAGTAEAELVAALDRLDTDDGHRSLGNPSQRRRDATGVSASSGPVGR
jgi:DNA-binding NarL/FixJ family response regulator